MPPTSAPCTKTRSNVVAQKRPTQATGRTNTMSIASSKYHLLTKTLCGNANRCCSRPGISGRRTHSV